MGKIEDDTGGGCSICGATPAVNAEGTYWLCGPCVFENYLAAQQLAEADRAGRVKELALACVPTTWLDPLLSGPDAVVRQSQGNEIEALLRAIRERIAALAPAA